jgi:dihydropyrimidinase
MLSLCVAIHTYTSLSAGKHIQGKVTTTISRGRLVWHDGKLDVLKSSGRMMLLPPFGPLFTGLDKQGASTAEQLMNAFSSRNGATPVSRGSQAAEEAMDAAGHEEL